MNQLAFLHDAAEKEAKQRAEAVERLNADIEALRKVELKQSKQIKEAEARLSEAQAESQRLAEEVVRLRTEEETLREAEAEARQQRVQESVAQAETEARRLAKEEKQRAAALRAGS